MSETTQHPPPAAPRESSYSRERIIALSDGVFAIAITLLVLDVVPHIAENVTGRELTHALREMIPSLLSYLLSFLVIGRFWDTHRLFFRFIPVADPRVVWRNLWVLLWITLIPATAALLGSHWQEPIALVLYALNLLSVIVALWLLWKYVSSAGYLRREALHPRIDAFVNRYALASFIGYALAIPAAWVSAPVSLIFIFVTTTVARWVANRVMRPVQGAAMSGADGGEDEGEVEL
jgi:uncharacterized membrane protein